MTRIRIHNRDFSLTAQLDNTALGKRIAAALPIRAHAQVWGSEIYFGIAVQAENEPGAKAEVRVGELAYWPPGNAFCIFFGPTPESTGDVPRAAGPVTVIGRLLEDPHALHRVKRGDELHVELD